MTSRTYIQFAPDPKKRCAASIPGEEIGAPPHRPQSEAADATGQWRNTHGKAPTDPLAAIIHIPLAGAFNDAWEMRISGS